MHTQPIELDLYMLHSNPLFLPFPHPPKCSPLSLPSLLPFPFSVARGTEMWKSTRTFYQSSSMRVQSERKCTPGIGFVGKPPPPMLSFPLLPLPHLSPPTAYRHAGEGRGRRSHTTHTSTHAPTSRVPLAPRRAPLLFWLPNELPFPHSSQPPFFSPFRLLDHFPPG